MDKIALKLHPEVEKTHTPTRSAVQKMFVPGLGEVDLEHVGSDRVEKLEKAGVLVKKDSKTSAKT